MTPAEDQTVGVLLAAGAFTAAIGTNANGTVKLFPEEIPDDTPLPAGTYERTDSAPEQVLDGTLAASRVSMQIAIWAKTREQANAIALQATIAMQAAGNQQTASATQYEPELDEYAAIRSFDVWEL